MSTVSVSFPAKISVLVPRWGVFSLGQPLAGIFAFILKFRVFLPRSVCREFFPFGCHVPENLSHRSSRKDIQSRLPSPTVEPLLKTDLFRRNMKLQFLFPCFSSLLLFFLFSLLFFPLITKRNFSCNLLKKSETKTIKASFRLSCSVAVGESKR